jgi:hypothetical protein
LLLVQAMSSLACSRHRAVWRGTGLDGLAALALFAANVAVIVALAGSRDRATGGGQVTHEYVDGVNKLGVIPKSDGALFAVARACILPRPLTLAWALSGRGDLVF